MLDAIFVYYRSYIDVIYAAGRYMDAVFVLLFLVISLPVHKNFVAFFFAS